MDYQNALAGLASGMAGQGGGMPDDDMGGDMIPCPMCQGTGQVPAAMLMGAGQPAMPPRLAARSPMMAGAGGGGGGAMLPPMSMGA